jgi:hypothetical protein
MAALNRRGLCVKSLFWASTEVGPAVAGLRSELAMRVIGQAPATGTLLAPGGAVRLRVTTPLVIPEAQVTMAVICAARGKDCLGPSLSASAPAVEVP